MQKGIEELNCQTLLKENGAVCLRKPFPYALQQIAAIKVATQICKGPLKKRLSSLNFNVFSINYQDFSVDVMPCAIESINHLDLTDPCRKLVIHSFRWILLELKRWIIRLRLRTRLFDDYGIIVNNLVWSSDGKVNEVSSARKIIASEKCAESWHSKISHAYGLEDNLDSVPISSIIDANFIEKRGGYLQFEKEFKDFDSLKLPFFYEDMNNSMKTLWEILRKDQQGELSKVKMKRTQDATDLICVIFSHMDANQQIRAVKEAGNIITLSLFCDPVWRCQFLPFLKQFFVHMKEDPLTRGEIFFCLSRALVVDFYNEIEPIGSREIFLAFLKSFTGFITLEFSHFSCPLVAFVENFFEWVLLPLFEIDKCMYEYAYRFFWTLFYDDESKSKFLLRCCKSFVPAIFRKGNFKRGVQMLENVSGNIIDLRVLKRQIVKDSIFVTLLSCSNPADCEQVDQILNYMFDKDQCSVSRYKVKIIRKEEKKRNCVPIDKAK